MNTVDVLFMHIKSFPAHVDYPTLTSCSNVFDEYTCGITCIIVVKHVRCFLQILGYFDYAFTAIFTVEILLKVNGLCPPLCAVN